MVCWSGGLLSDEGTKTIREELKEILSEQGYSEGVDRRARSAIGIGISWSDKEPEVVARAIAAWRIVCQLNGANLSAMRSARESEQGEKVSLAAKKVSEGFLVGVREGELRLQVLRAQVLFDRVAYLVQVPAASRRHTERPPRTRAVAVQKRFILRARI